MFNKLYVNMVQAGEVGGTLDVTSEASGQTPGKSQRIKGKVIVGHGYPIVVITVAFLIIVPSHGKVVPSFQAVFNELMNGERLPRLTNSLSTAISGLIQHQYGKIAAVGISPFPVQASFRS